MVNIGQEPTRSLRKDKNEALIKSIRDKREFTNNDKIVIGKRPGSGKKHI
jgi:hypothetical protein